jgi:pyruvate formate lyase activating enzyme
VCTHDAVVRLADGTFSADPYHCARCGECTDSCPTGGREIIGAEYSVDAVLETVEKDRVFYEESGGGVTFSGGEPMAQPAFLLALLEACRAHNLHRVVDTCGMANESTVRAVAELTDMFLYDLKLMDDDRHRMFTGVDNRPILENLEILAELDADVWVRFPLIPSVNDDDENIDALAAFVAALGKDYPIHLLPYHAIARDKYGRFGQTYPLEGLAPPGEDGIAAAAARLRAAGLRVDIGG